MASVKLDARLGVEPRSPVYKTGASPQCLQAEMVAYRGFEPRSPDWKSGASPRNAYTRVIGGRWRNASVLLRTLSFTPTSGGGSCNLLDVSGARAIEPLGRQAHLGFQDQLPATWRHLPKK